MIDIHTHLLPSLGEGINTLEQAVEIAKSMAMQGITIAFCTPHMDKNISLDTLYRSFISLHDHLMDNQVNLRLYLGAELQLSSTLIEDLQAMDLLNTIHTTSITLLLPQVAPIKNWQEVISTLVKDNYSVIIAQPERHRYLSSMNHFSLFKQLGAKIEVSTSSLLGKNGRHAKKWAWLLLDNGMVDYVASGVVANSIYDYQEARALILQKYGENIERSLFIHNPMKLVIEAQKTMKLREARG